MHLFNCIKHPQNLLLMDTFLCKYRKVDQAQTKFMIVTLFRERERERMGQEEDDGGVYFKPFIS